jgi:ABC-type multidrug transport system fused ATPase/permease subunit
MIGLACIARFHGAPRGLFEVPTGQTTPSPPRRDMVQACVGATSINARSDGPGDHRLLGDRLVDSATIAGMRQRQARASQNATTGKRGSVHQRSFLFSGTILDNIRFGRPGATRAEVEAAARAVGADQVIAGLPDGYDTQVGERGALLAAGERQLVAFARAWIADPALLILDEATSNLDAASEARITDALQRLRSGRTTIIIAHRLTTIAQADQIAVVEDGRIVESGTPAELRARGGRFADLFTRWLAGAA